MLQQSLKWAHCRVRTTLILLCEAVLEACPQLVVQIHLYVQDVYGEDRLAMTGDIESEK